MHTSTRENNIIIIKLIPKIIEYPHTIITYRTTRMNNQSLKVQINTDH